MNASDNVTSFNILSESKATRDSIVSNINDDKYNIIHFVGNIFFSKASPKDSYFLTNDNDIVKFKEISNALTNKQTKTFLFFDAQIYNIDGMRLINTMHIFSEIIAQFDYNHIVGVMIKNYPVFNSETRGIITRFYTNLLSKNNQGISLLKALTKDQSLKTFESDNLLAMTSFTLFGSPWNML